MSGSRWLWATVAGTVVAFPIAVLLAPSGSASTPQALTWLLFLTSSVHVASTGFLFSLQEVRQQVRVHPARYVMVPAALVCGAAALAVLTSPSSLAWLLIPYFAWQQWHYQKQNLGMAALAASAQRLPALDQTERRLILVAGIAGMLGLIAHPGLVQLHVQPDTGPLFAASGLLLLIVVCAGLLRLLRRTQPAGFAAVYVMGLLFNAPIFLFSSPYAAVGGMTIAHGFQYLLLVAMMGAGQERGIDRVLGLALFANIALIGGAVLNAASHLHGGELRAVYGGYLGVVMAHFVIDAGIWRLRDPAVREIVSGRLPFLLPPRVPVPEAVRG